MTVNYIDFMNNEHDGSNSILSWFGYIPLARTYTAHINVGKQNCHLIEHDAYDDTHKAQTLVYYKFSSAINIFGQIAHLCTELELFK